MVVKETAQQGTPELGQGHEENEMGIISGPERGFQVLVDQIGNPQAESAPGHAGKDLHGGEIVKIPATKPKQRNHRDEPESVFKDRDTAFPIEKNTPVFHQHPGQELSYAHNYHIPDIIETQVLEHVNAEIGRGYVGGEKKDKERDEDFMHSRVAFIPPYRENKTRKSPGDMEPVGGLVHQGDIMYGTKTEKGRRKKKHKKADEVFAVNVKQEGSQETGRKIGHGYKPVPETEELSPLIRGQIFTHKSKPGRRGDASAYRVKNHEKYEKIYRRAGRRENAERGKKKAEGLGENRPENDFFAAFEVIDEKFGEDLGERRHQHR